MNRVLVGIASLAGVMLLVGMMLGGLYLRSLRTPVAAGQAEASPSPLAISPRPTDAPSPSPTEVASPTAPSPSARPAVPAGGVPSPMAPSCPAEVITSFTARAAPDSVVVSWTVSGGCGNESGWLQGSYGINGPTGAGYPGLWVVPIQRPSTSYTDHPHKPANSQGVCLFALSYWIDFNGNAPNGRAVPAANTTVSNVNLC